MATCKHTAPRSSTYPDPLRNAPQRPVTNPPQKSLTCNIPLFDDGPRSLPFQSYLPEDPPPYKEYAEPGSYAPSRDLIDLDNNVRTADVTVDVDGDGLDDLDLPNPFDPPVPKPQTTMAFPTPNPYADGSHARSRNGPFSTACDGLPGFVDPSLLLTRTSGEQARIAPEPILPIPRSTSPDPIISTPPRRRAHAPPLHSKPCPAPPLHLKTGAAPPLHLRAAPVPPSHSQPVPTPHARTPRGASHPKRDMPPEVDPIMFQTLYATNRDIQAIKQVFKAWGDQLSSEPKNNLGREIKLIVETLQANADILFETSEAMLEKYGDFLAAIGKRSCARSEGELKRLCVRLAEGSDTVSAYVTNMREKLHDLVKSVEAAMHEAEKRATRNKHLRIFVKMLGMLNIGMEVGASLSQLAPPPAGIAATLGFGGASGFIASLAKTAEQYRKDHYTETDFETALKVLNKDIPDALKKAELSLGSLRACQEYLKLDLSMRDALRAKPFKSSAASQILQNAGLKLEEISSVLFLIRPVFK